MWKHVVIVVVSWIARFVVSLRYKVTVTGKEQIALLKKKKGILFLPNHPALMDPILVAMQICPQFHARPLVIEYIYRQGLAHAFVSLIDALPIPNFETSVNELKLKQAEEVMGKIVHGLKKGENFMIYPSGRLKDTGKEIIGGASAIQAILEQVPDLTVVLIRTTGLWGSSFSRALTGKSPNLKTVLWNGFKTLLKNFIFFAPRRRVLLEFELEPKGFPKTGSRIEVNKFLEEWYNQYRSEMGTVVMEEPLTLVPQLFYSKKVPTPYVKKARKELLDKNKLSSKQEHEVFAYLSELAKRPVDEIEIDMNLALDLALDSLDIAQVAVFLADHFHVPTVHPAELRTVEDVLKIASGSDQLGLDADLKDVANWPKEQGRKDPLFPEGKTIVEAFLQTAERMGNHGAVADGMIGVLSYRKLKIAALILSEEMKKIPGKHVGVLLPASVAAYLVILAIQMANKVPVMLNWTLGPKYLDYMIDAADVKRVISSWKFLEQLSYVEFGELTSKLLLLENIKKRTSIFKKCKALLLSYLPTSALLRWLAIPSDAADKPAVILFTSGTESKPKGVPLSHRNILSNQKAAADCIDLNRKDIFLGVLPPFHSFGFTVTGLLPILLGVRAVYYPNPTDSFALVKQIVHWKISLFCSAPSFLKGLLKVGKEKDLKTVRLFVSGAEKASDELFKKIRHLGSELIEGYGITECSPVLSINCPDDKAKGVGKLIPGVEMRVIHPETLKVLAGGEEGELCVRGPNVFSGYLEHTGGHTSPFIEIEGKSYYRTGDIGHVDKEGYIILSGRKKRFAKIGGEMISLVALEQALSHALTHEGKIQDDESHLAVCASEEDPSKAFLVVFANLPLNLKEVNQILKDAGFSRLVKISHVQHIDKIPLLGSGKVDYQKLQSLVETIL